MFHLFAILVKVVDPLAIKIYRTLFSNFLIPSSSTWIKACAVISLVLSFYNFQTPSFCENSSIVVLALGRILTSNPDMLKSKFGLSFEYTEMNVSSHWMVVSERGSLFLISQKTALPRLTSCFIRRILQSLGQHFLLLYPTMFSLFGSGFSVRNRWIKSRESPS